MTSFLTKVISTRVPTDDYFEIARIAHENHMNISDYVFMLIHTFKNQSTISEQEYNELKNQLEINRKKYHELKANSDTKLAQYSNLVSKWNDCNKEIDRLKFEYSRLEGEYSRLEEFTKSKYPEKWLWVKNQLQIR